MAWRGPGRGGATAGRRPSGAGVKECCGGPGAQIAAADEGAKSSVRRASLPSSYGSRGATGGADTKRGALLVNVAARPRQGTRVVPRWMGPFRPVCQPTPCPPVTEVGLWGALGATPFSIEPTEIKTHYL